MRLSVVEELAAVALGLVAVAAGTTSGLVVGLARNLVNMACICNKTEEPSEFPCH